MSSDERPKLKYIYNLPYREREQLCRILDIHDKWKSLGGHMEFDTLEIQELERLERRGKSPTDELLTKWSQQNHTVQELFVLLSRIRHFQAMAILKPFVETKYHAMMYEGEGSVTRLLKVQDPGEGASGITVHSASKMTPNPNNTHGSANGSPVVNGGDDKILTYGQHNLNVTGLPEGGKLNIVDTQQKIQNVRSPESIENNIPVQRNVAGANNSAFAAVPGTMSKAAGAAKALEKLKISPAGMAALNTPAAPSFNISPGASSHNAQNQQLNLPVSSPPQRKLSDVSLASSMMEWSLPQQEYKELEAATNGWDRRNILGRGGFGTVYRGTWKNTQVAIKRLELPKGDAQESQEMQRLQSLKELSILQSIRHDNILQLYGFSISGDQPCLVYQFMENGSLEVRLMCRNGTPPLTWHQRYNIAKGTARGLQYLHTIREKPLIHGDIKSANILLDSNLEARIGDFGLAREGPQNHYTHMKVSRVHGTRPYLPDEFLRSKKLSTKVDTYSFGVVLFELASGQRAYDDTRPNKFLKDEVINCPPDRTLQLFDKKIGLIAQNHYNIFTHLINLGKWCVAKNTKERPEMEVVWKQLDSHSKEWLDTPGAMPSPSPLELQVYYDQQGQRRQSLTQSPNIYPPGSGHPPSGHNPTNGQPSGHGFSPAPGFAFPSIAAYPVNSHQGSSHPPGILPVVARPVAAAPVISQANNIPPIFGVQQKSPVTPHLMRLGSGEGGASSPNSPHILQAPLQSPTISILPATGSTVSPSGSHSSLSESSSELSSRESHVSQAVPPNDWRDQGEQAGLGDLPILSILGIKDDDVNSSVPESQEVLSSSPEGTSAQDTVQNT